MRILALIISSIILWGCNKAEKDNVSTSDTKAKIYKRHEVTPLLREKVKQSQESGNTKFMAILEHQMGMKKDTAYKHIRRLYKKGKMKRVTNDRGNIEYVYTLHLPSLGAVDMYFDAFYDDNKSLYMIECKPMVSDTSQIETYIDEMAYLLTEKYGTPLYLFKNTPYTGKIWLDNTLIIELYCLNNKLIVQYKDGTNPYEKANEL